jgi:hypothetical protein
MVGSLKRDESRRLYEGPNSSEPLCLECTNDSERAEGEVEVEVEEFSREDSTAKGQPKGSHENNKTLLRSTLRALSRKFSSAGGGDAGSKKKVCLICLENLDEEDFRTGEAISLECNCKGDITYRHKACAVKWAQVKGSTVCDICKAPIRNLPDIEQLPPPDLLEPLSPQDATTIYLTDENVPPALDLSFDFLRITWIATIVCVLFVQLDLQESLWIGSIVGLSYILMVKLFECCSNRIQRYRARASELSSSSEGDENAQRFNATAWYGIVSPPV